MSSMAFAINAGGISGLSLGNLLLAFNRSGALTVYQWIGTGSATGITGCSSHEKIEIPDERLPFLLDNMTVRFQLEGGIAGWGITEMKFEVFLSNQSDPLYTVTRRPMVNGILVGGINSLGILRRVTSDNVWTIESFMTISVITEQLGFRHEGWQRPFSFQ